MTASLKPGDPSFWEQERFRVDFIRKEADAIISFCCQHPDRLKERLRNKFNRPFKKLCEEMAEHILEYH